MARAERHVTRDAGDQQGLTDGAKGSALFPSLSACCVVDNPSVQLNQKPLGRTFTEEHRIAVVVMTVPVHISHIIQVKIRTQGD